MNKERILRNANYICKNFNNAEGPFKLEICTNTKELSNFYNTYDGITEFLYIAPEDEIKDAIENGAVFFGIYSKDKLAGVAKVA